jgi:mono/diheme cytochrome c family protein
MNKLKTLVLMSITATVFAIGITSCAGPTESEAQTASVERGRYLVITTGCNDCHTARYAQSEGNVPEEQWLTGDRLGWRGPWGTTYPPNLRLYMQDLTEDQWVARASELRTRPPMPWFNVNRMTDEDLRAVYQFIRSLGPAGEPAPAYVPPDQEPAPPYIQFP